MVKYITRRLLETIIILVAITLIIFMAFVYPWGGIDDFYPLASDSPEVREKIEQLREALGLNDNFFVQYGRWIRDLFTQESIMPASYYSG